jgi:Fe-Mn family superoxide dismutase
MEECSRRDLLKNAAGVSMLGLINLYAPAHAEEKPVDPKKTAANEPIECSQLPLPYAYDALEPHIDKETIEIHYTRHHAAYVKNFNSALQRLDFARTMKDMTFIKHWCKELAFNGSGHVLHTLYWGNMSAQGGQPKGELSALIEKSFKTFDNFIEQFSAAAKTVEGSGWGILGFEPCTKRLIVLQSEKHQDIALWGTYPLLVCDVWEHAYYLKYRSARGTYVDNFMKIINWSEVERRYELVKSLRIY